MSSKIFDNILNQNNFGLLLLLLNNSKFIVVTRQNNGRSVEAEERMLKKRKKFCLSDANRSTLTISPVKNYKKKQFSFTTGKILVEFIKISNILL